MTSPTGIAGAAEQLAQLLADEIDRIANRWLPAFIALHGEHDFFVAHVRDDLAQAQRPGADAEYWVQLLQSWSDDEPVGAVPLRGEAPHG